MSISSPKDAQRPARRKLVADRLPLRLLYWIYERRLLHQIDRRRVPRHVGIILDGNRRHARDKGVNDPLKIYRPGAEKLDEILDWCAELSNSRRNALGILDRKLQTIAERGLWHPCSH